MMGRDRPCGREGQCEPSIEAGSDGKGMIGVFDVLALRQEDGVPRIGCVVVGIVCALLPKWCLDTGGSVLSSRLSTPINRC